MELYSFPHSGQVISVISVSPYLLLVCRKLNGTQPCGYACKGLMYCMQSAWHPVEEWISSFVSPVAFSS